METFWVTALLFLYPLVLIQPTQGLPALPKRELTCVQRTNHPRSTVNKVSNLRAQEGSA